MGARGNIVILHGNGQRIYLYTHWRGREIGEMLRRALARGEERWSDPVYLGRIVFAEMTRGEEDELAGCGIAPYGMWPDYDELHVDVLHGLVRTVRILPIEGPDGIWEAHAEQTLGEATFAEFVAGEAPVLAE